MKELKFRTPVKCQNGHKAFWYWSVSGMWDIKTIKSPESVCNCPTFNLGEEWAGAGENQIRRIIKKHETIEAE